MSRNEKIQNDLTEMDFLLPLYMINQMYVLKKSFSTFWSGKNDLLFWPFLGYFSHFQVFGKFSDHLMIVDIGHQKQINDLSIKPSSYNYSANKPSNFISIELFQVECSHTCVRVNIG